MIPEEQARTEKKKKGICTIKIHEEVNKRHTYLIKTIVPETTSTIDQQRSHVLIFGGTMGAI